MPDLLTERLDQIRERVRVGTVREAAADRDFLMAEVDRLHLLTEEPSRDPREHHATTCDHLVGVGRRICTCGLAGLVGDPGDLVAADPYGRSVDAP